MAYCQTIHEKTRECERGILTDCLLTVQFELLDELSDQKFWLALDYWWKKQGNKVIDGDKKLHDCIKILGNVEVKIVGAGSVLCGTKCVWRKVKWNYDQKLAGVARYEDFGVCTCNHAHILSYHRRLLFNDSRFSRGKARSNTAIYFHYILLSSDTIWMSSRARKRKCLYRLTNDEKTRE